MEKSTSLGCPATLTTRLFSVLAITLIAVILPGCAALKPGESIRFKSETELGVSAIRLEWLKQCEGPGGTMPTNDIGSLLQDYADLATAFRLCANRHNSFIEYMEPIVKKEQEGNP